MIQYTFDRDAGKLEYKISFSNSHDLCGEKFNITMSVESDDKTKLIDLLDSNFSFLKHCIEKQIKKVKLNLETSLNENST